MSPLSEFISRIYSTDELPAILQRVGVQDKRRRLNEEVLYNVWGDEIETEESLLAGLTEMERAALQNSYPDGAFTNSQIRNGASILYIIGIMYCFMGISLATTHFINPSIDIIKKKGTMNAETMNATLLAFTNGLAETFIIINSIFFGVSDIGISTVVQQAAFYCLVI
jgi:hypothetical protein